MPELSRFFGLIITMYWADHPPPHFHVRYGRQRAVVEIETLAVIAGSLSPRALALVVEWAARHKEELRANWRLARAHQPLRPVPPLE
jgi:Domain of unknown function (DUF4160)